MPLHYMPTYLHTYVPTYLHTYIRTYGHTYIHTYTYMHIHTYIHTYMHTHTHIHTYIHTYLHTYNTYTPEKGEDESQRETNTVMQDWEEPIAKHLLLSACGFRGACIGQGRSTA